MGIKIKATGGSKLNDSPDPIENFFVGFASFVNHVSVLRYCFLFS